MNTTKGIPAKEVPTWPKLDNDIKHHVIKHFKKCAKAGRPVVKLIDYGMADCVEDAVLFHPNRPVEESSFLDNEYIQVKVYSFKDVPGRRMQVIIRTRGHQDGRAFYSYTEAFHLADATDISWLERLVSRK